DRARSSCRPVLLCAHRRPRTGAQHRLGLRARQPRAADDHRTAARVRRNQRPAAAVAEAEGKRLGSRKLKTVRPGWLSIETWPPCRSTIAFTIESPRPLPSGDADPGARRTLLDPSAL